uniref:Protein GOLM2 n=1 Tax=Xenopus tropicalis TaxID=8364 RepID=A0A6I8QJK3_XENTR
MVGFGAPRRTGRLPPFVLVALLAVIGLLAFNYWSVSARQAALHDELLGLQAQVQRTEVARSRLEKRNSELILQADTHRRQMEQKQGEYQGLGERLQARDIQAQRCELEKTKLQNNVSLQMADISRLKEQLAELRHEFLRQEDQLHEYKNNNTLLQKSLQEESQQCAQQLAERKREYEENLTKLKEELGKEPKKEEEEGGAVEKKIPPLASEVKLKVEDPSSNRLPYAQDGVKPDSDAGMPEIEDNRPAKEENLPKDVKGQDTGAFPSQSKSLHEQHPSLQPVAFTEIEVKNPLPADKKDSVQPPDVEENALQLEPQPQKQKIHDSKTMGFNLKQSRFFDENESPVDPQHGSKVADYNGDDGNVGEYEADKQAELAYNEEEDGDGGEEDVQDDDHDGQADVGEYHKDHLNETL